ncbi:hypothetical protein [Brenneria corticis]|uniref:Lipoprotein n=1 Tax=Brenneria corticis TaxID=2173106 RepID=A0A2U1TVE8_9GAMM|nr:hypothetical protein [Brenneria sp. CFCC 11842]PWC13403.1 hypothetical protein DDT56_15225 [Brenneria sp. CFCC 11842]
MRLVVSLIIGLLLSGCAIKFGDVKKGGAIEYFETHYTTKMRSPMPGGSIILMMDTYLQPMVINYCKLRNGRLVSVWCVDENNFPLFKVKYSGPTDVPLMVNGNMTMFTAYPLLEVLERNNTASDQEWLNDVKKRWGFDPDKLDQ